MDEPIEQQSGVEQSSYSTTSNVINDFAKPVRLKIHSWTQSKCFACAPQDVNAVHVIEQPTYDMDTLT